MDPTLYEYTDEHGRTRLIYAAGVQRYEGGRGYVVKHYVWTSERHTYTVHNADGAVSDWRWTTLRRAGRLATPALAYAA